MAGKSGKSQKQINPQDLASRITKGREETAARQLVVNFAPTFAHESFKTQLWDAVREEGMDLELLLEEMRTSNDDVREWCRDKAFVRWVRRSEVTTAEGQLKALVGLSMTALADVLSEQDPKFNGAKVSAARLVLEAARLLQAKSTVVVKDERIARASKEELLEIINKNKNLLVTEAEKDE